MDTATATENLVITRAGKAEVVDHTHLLEWTLIALADGPDVDFAQYADKVELVTEHGLALLHLELSWYGGEEPSTLHAYDAATDETHAEWEV